MALSDPTQEPCCTDCTCSPHPDPQFADPEVVSRLYVTRAEAAAVMVAVMRSAGVSEVYVPDTAVLEAEGYALVVEPNAVGSFTAFRVVPPQGPHQLPDPASYIESVLPGELDAAGVPGPTARPAEG